jgi:Ca2+-binding RTX toxin-like protein
MKLRAVFAAATLAAPFALALTGSAAPSYAATMCQGKPATIEGRTGILTGTEGDDVIVAHRRVSGVDALGGNDLICVEFGYVSTGLGDDSVVSDAPSGYFTSVSLVGGNDTYVSRAGGRSEVTVDAISSFHAVLEGGGTVWLNPTSTPGTGTIEYGTAYSFLYAFGEKQARVDLTAQTASVDGLLAITTSGLRYATATGCNVRMKGNDKNDVLFAFGQNLVVSGGDGRDLLLGGKRRGLDQGTCGRYRSVFRGQGGPDHMTGQRGDDVLIGGPGRDVAEGGGGVDTCRAEVRKHCER